MGQILYFAILATVGCAAAMAFRWPVMFGAGALVSVICLVVELLQHASIDSAMLEAGASFLVVQLAYVIGGALFGLRWKRSETRKNLRV